ncbi:MAG: hypothetical protein ACT4OF_06115 [Caulobacteraceae bacterium]
MTQAHSIITASRVEAYVASALRLLGWLLGVILRLNPAGRSVRLRHLLSRAERAVECILFLRAVALYGPPPQRKRHPRSAPNGFRRVASNRGSFFSSVKIRARKAGALARVIALIDALTRPERAVAYFLKQICKGLRLSRLIVVAPPACALARVLAAESAFCDTS